MQTLALDYFKLAAMVPRPAFGAAAPRKLSPGQNGNGFFITPPKGNNNVVQRQAPQAAPKPQPMPGSGSTDYKIGGVGAMLRPTASLLNPTSMGAKNFMSGAEKHLKIEPTSNVRPETKPDVPGSVGITRPMKAASALAYFAMTA